MLLFGLPYFGSFYNFTFQLHLNRNENIKENIKTIMFVLECFEELTKRFYFDSNCDNGLVRYIILSQDLVLKFQVSLVETAIMQNLCILFGRKFCLVFDINTATDTKVDVDTRSKIN